MGQAILYGQKQQGVDIQGIIDDYYAYAGENISAGDFVEFVNGIASRTATTSSIKSFSSYSPKSIGITLIDEDKFLIAYVIPNSSKYKCCAKVGTISGITITLGTEYTIADTASDVAVISVDTNKCIIVYTSSYDIYGVGCSIADTAITKGNLASLGTGSSSAHCNNPTLVNMTTSKAVLSYNKNNSAYVVVITLNTSTLALSVKSNTIQPTGYSVWGNVSICEITFTGYEDYPCYLLLGRDTNNNLGILVPIMITSNNTVGYITTPYTFFNGSSYYQKACQIAPDKYFIMFIDAVSGVYIGKAVICYKPSSGNTLSFGNVYTFYNSGGGVYNNSTSLLAIEENKVLLIYTTRTDDSPSKADNIKMQIATINNNEITFGTTNSMGSTGSASLYPQLTKIEDNTILVAYNHNSTYGYSRLYNCEGNTPVPNFYNYTYETQVRKVTTPQFDGIAQTSGSGGSDTGHNQQVEVLTIANPTEEHDIVDTNYVSMYNEVMTTSDDNTFIVEEE